MLSRYLSYEEIHQGLFRDNLLQLLQLLQSCLQTDGFKSYYQYRLTLLRSHAKVKIRTGTLYLSLANRIEARWNLQSGFLGSMPIALFRVSRAASDFFSACCT